MDEFDAGQRELQDMSVSEMEPLERLLDDDFPEMWRAMATSLFVFLTDTELAGLNADQKARLSIVLTRRLAQDVDGGMRYIPVGFDWKRNQVARAVVEGFTGANVTELARRHGITDTRVRQIIAAWRKERERQFRDRQGTLQLDEHGR